MARISLPGRVLAALAQVAADRAREAHASSTSLTEQFSALPTALTWASGSGSHHATTFLPLSLPLSRVGESSGNSASAAASRSTLDAGP